MRHQVSGYKLSRGKDERDNLKKVMLGQFFTHEKIETTSAKAHFIRSDAEKLITLARNSAKGTDADKMNARRLAAAQLGNNPDIVKKLFDDIAPRFATRNGGYTRMFKLGPRQGDAAEMVLMELVD